MGSSIQDYAKKINSRLTLLDCLSLFVTTLFIALFALFLFKQQESKSIPVSYLQYSGKEPTDSPEEDSRPFGSINGKTYTFSWCQNSSRTLVKNRVYFATELAAEQKGRTLSKLCQK